MTIHASAAFDEPLRTEQDMIIRVRELLAPAANPGRLWVLVLDGAGRQTPVLIPLENRPEFPEPALLDHLIAALTACVEQHTEGRGQLLFVVERMGPFGATHQDHCWAAALAGACDRAGLGLAATLLLSPGGVSPLGA